MKLIFLGLFLAAGCGIPTVLRLFYSVPAATVTSCETSWSHKYYAHVSLDSGRELSLTKEDIPNPKECLRVGTTVEKQRFEFWYRINGQSYRSTSETWRVVPVLAAGGLLLALIGLILRSKGA